MTVDAVARTSAQIDAWIRLYTSAVPFEVAQDRRDEVLADIRDQVQWARGHQVPARRIARGLLGRAVRGAPADIAWAISIASPGRVLDRALVGLVAVVTLGLIAVCVVAISRHSPDSAQGDALAVIFAILLGMGALALLARRRTRGLAGLWVTASAHVVLFDGIDYLADSTTILRRVTSVVPDWQTGVLVADAGIILLCIAAAVWWTRTTLDVEGDRG